MPETNNTPSKLGYIMPPEWHPHESTWLSWPHNKITWPDLKPIETAYVEIIKALHYGEKVNILVNNEDAEQYVKNKLKKNNVNLHQINFFAIPTADAWIRDYGPNFITKKNSASKIFFPDIAFNKWTFNAWGNKYDDLLADNEIPSKINEHLKIKCFKPNIVLEGGSIDVNGNGICMTTEQCLLNKNRNPGLSKKEIEQYLMDYLGVNRILWLKKGIEGDDTDGHIDDIARFVSEGAVLCCLSDKKDRNYAALAENFNILQNYKINGKKLNVAKLPMPDVKDENGPLPASYANFYMGNGAVLVPIFNDKNDKKALEIIQKFFPKRKITGISCRKLVEGLGTIHCITQQQPECTINNFL